jgi:hypothetical protein
MRSFFLFPHQAPGCDLIRPLSRQRLQGKMGEIIFESVDELLLDSISDM